jgi:hypothetical protein
VHRWVISHLEVSMKDLTFAVHVKSNRDMAHALRDCRKRLKNKLEGHGAIQARRSQPDHSRPIFGAAEALASAFR